MCVCAHKYVSTHTMEYYSAIKKNEISPVVISWMDLEGTMPGEIDQSKEDKNGVISLICGILKRQQQEQACRSRK